MWIIQPMCNRVWIGIYLLLSLQAAAWAAEGTAALNNDMAQMSQRIAPKLANAASNSTANLETPLPEDLKTPPKLTTANVRSGILGVWLRPKANISAQEQLNTLKQAGYTDIFVETFYHGMTIYPSQIAPQRPELQGRDLLQEFSDAAAEQGVRLHAWFEVLYWQPPSQYGIRGGLLSLHPDWETVNAQGQVSRTNPDQMGFADPALYQVRQTVYGLAQELGQWYPKVGLHLDYLRYPAQGDFGYHAAAQTAYQEQYSALPSAQTGAWLAWRQGVLAQVAQGMSQSYRVAGGQGLVSAAVNPMFPLRHAAAQQNWTMWRDIDIFIPMAYSKSTLFLRGLAEYIRLRSPSTVWMGLALGSGYPSLDAQIKVLKPQGYSNYVVFGR